MYPIARQPESLVQVKLLVRQLDYDKSFDLSCLYSFEKYFFTNTAGEAFWDTLSPALFNI